VAISRTANRGGRLSAAPIAWALPILLILSFQLNAGEPEAHGFNGLDNPDQYDNATLSWRKANMTWYESYPEPGSEECIKYNGCFWEGKFTLYGDEKKPLEWVANTHILSVHSKDFEKYKGKILRLRKDGKQIDAMVFDSCSDDDCDGCCTENCKETGFLIDMEIHTLEKFGVEQGVVEWTCLDCEE
jgi:hypothetical protein